MADELRTRRLPAVYRVDTREVCRRILSLYPNTTALVVIGSVTTGTWDRDSDLDLVWVYRGKLRRKWREELDYHHDGPVELVPFNLTQVGTHFRQHSPMAHALQRGLPLYDPEGLQRRWQALTLGLPKRQWIDETYDFMWYRFEWGWDSLKRERDFHRLAKHATEDCSCCVSEALTRATLNLVRLLLVLRGHVPLCKAHTRELFPAILRGSRLRQAMEITLRAHHEKRDLTLGEARQVAHLGQWTKKQLVAELGVPPAEEKAQEVRRLLARA
jgi:hypothetical protein